MEKFLLSALVTGAIFTNAQAQIATGTTMMGGNLNYWGPTSKNDNNQAGYSSTTKNKQFEISPIVGRFIAENLAIGIDARFSFSKTNSHYPIFSSNYTFAGEYYEQIQKGRSINVGPIIRYYKFVSEKAAFYGQFSGGYTNNYISSYTSAFSNEGIYTPSTSGSTRSEGFYGQVSPGFVFFPINKLGLELYLPGLSYNRLIDKTDDSKRVDASLGANFGLRYLQMGAFFYLGRS
ncbi:hypothetical protein [Hymenobacter crusticola]|uniref:Outer membrane protein beta-barrel domain-containing protein n=1 Tax=Hymenobacter crusticola TaxID=1770526 RepID=A0A243W6P9_9BACT|nr:hypothetical protein [Hymenobacter crusticola]OUJ70228.1 hypothetical protein BXP70_25035 [Hymenobacter crusticola]